MPGKRNHLLPYIIGGVTLVVIFVIFLLVQRHNSTNGIEQYTVGRADVTEIITITGTTEAQEELELGFQVAGRIASLPVKIGEFIQKGDILGELNMTRIKTELTEANARVSVEEARLDEVLRGTRAEEITIKEQSLLIAEQKLMDEHESSIIIDRSAFTVADDAIHNKADGIFTSPTSANPKLIFLVSTDQQLQSSLENNRVVIEQLLSKWEQELPSFSDTVNGIELLGDAKNYLYTIATFLDDAARALSGLQPTGNITQTNIDAWKASVATARSAISAELTTLTNQIQTIRNQELAVTQTEQELNLLTSGATEEEIAQIRAQLNQARAAAATLRSRIQEYSIEAPTPGQITDLIYSVGESVNANTPVVRMIGSRNTSDQQFLQLTVYIPEIDITKINQETLGSVRAPYATFEALPDTEYELRLVSIEPTETIYEGVSTYKAIFALTSNTMQIKSGMTADVTLTTQIKEEVLAIPSYFISRDGSNFVVNKKVGDEIQTTEIIRGIVGSDGMVEIISGIEEGDVIFFIEEEE